MEKNKEKERIIGIDLGTTYSCVSIMRQGKVEIIQDSKTGIRTIPSIVCFKEEEEPLIGINAKNNMIEYYKSTIYDNKRLIGHKFSNPNIKKDLKNWPMKIIEDKKTGYPNYLIKIKNKEYKYSPEDISSFILKYLKEYSEIFEGYKKINNVIITVPAHFNNLQRESTIKSAKKVGFKNIKILNEPTAAAIAYFDMFKSKNEKIILIFDLGGGTFDCSILKYQNNEYYVLSSFGEEHLGGEDFNNRLRDYIMEEIKKNEKFKNIDFSNKEDKKIIKFDKKMKSEIENTKIQLSLEDNVIFYLDSIYGIDEFELKISRKKYEELCMDLFNKCFKKVDQAIKFAKINKNDINEIILVGGSTRTPKIKEMVQQYFNGKLPLQNINPDEVVAYGALVSNYTNVKINDITTKAIGIKIINQEFDIIIPTGTVLPLRNENLLKFSKNYIIKRNNRNNIAIKIYEGNNKNVECNVFLGQFIVEIYENEEKVRINMSIDNNSILTVSACFDNEKNKRNKITLTLNE